MWVSLWLLVPMAAISAVVVVATLAILHFEMRDRGRPLFGTGDLHLGNDEVLSRFCILYVPLKRERWSLWRGD